MNLPSAQQFQTPNAKPLNNTQTSRYPIVTTTCLQQRRSPKQTAIGATTTTSHSVPNQDIPHKHPPKSKPGIPYKIGLYPGRFVDVESSLYLGLIPGGYQGVLQGFPVPCRVIGFRCLGFSVEKASQGFFYGLECSKPWTLTLNPGPLTPKP